MYSSFVLTCAISILLIFSEPVSGVKAVNSSRRYSRQPQPTKDKQRKATKELRGYMRGQLEAYTNALFKCEGIAGYESPTAPLEFSVTQHNVWEWETAEKIRTTRHKLDLCMKELQQQNKAANVYVAHAGTCRLGFKL